MLKRFYVSGVRALRGVAKSTGVIATLERNMQESRTALWLRSLFAIYDIQDMAKLDLPWWNLEAIVQADNFLKTRTSAKVFEYGSGASTIWLARRSGRVVSIEHDPEWHAVVSEHLARFPNAKVRLIEADPTPVPGYLSAKKGWRGRSFEAYATSIDEEAGPFDLIVVDGRARSACLAHAVKRLAPGGIILFDNSGRSRYREAISGSGLSARTFRGATACLPYPDETTILKHRNSLTSAT